MNLTFLIELRRLVKEFCKAEYGDPYYHASLIRLINYRIKEEKEEDEE